MLVVLSDSRNDQYWSSLPSAPVTGGDVCMCHCTNLMKMFVFSMPCPRATLQMRNKAHSWYMILVRFSC
ncbi:hypothetical protein Pdw03_2969 [Penicillium digitatum]|uniref:Uncharacterized protein n=1 Tax=Penicillium digitatum TaxID=36651 RepID=A0A7T7BHN0_PENDI|nr:hypothetical protein Pdw03_2969 [Penicillium digitatum]